MVDLDLRRLVVESIAAGVPAYSIYIGVETATDLSCGFLTESIAIVAVYTVKPAV